MIRSMTGYGRGKAREGEWAVVAEVRSVNARGREVRFRIPSELSELEPALRELVQKRAARGRVDVNIDWEGCGPGPKKYVFNAAGASAALEAWKRLNEEYALPDPPRAEVLLRLPGVLEPVSEAGLDMSSVAGPVLSALDQALTEHTRARDVEGARLAEDLRERAVIIERLVGELRPLVMGLIETRAKEIRTRVEQLLAEIPIDETRLAQEIALAGQRADVTEELVRLDAHLSRLFKVFEDGAEEVGRTLDFLVQEIRREINTLGAKTGNPEIDERTLRIKTELEKIREQAANLE